MMDVEKIHTLDELLSRCLHCGMCLPVCPTYALTFDERSSPRGRIRLMKLVEEGTLGLSDEFVNEMYFCLDCQACETACPAGVQYGALVEDAREMISLEKKEPFSFHFLKSILLYVLESKSRAKIAAKLLRFYQRSGLREAIDASNILSIISAKLQQKHALLPTSSEKPFDETVPEILSPKGNPRGRVAFLSGCIMNVAFSDVHRDAVNVLLANGFEVIIPPEQVCCGSLHAHNGEMEKAKLLARTNIDVFEKYMFDVLVIDSAGCSAFMKEYGKVLADDVKYAERAKLLSMKIRDISEFLAEVGIVPPTKALRQRVTYHEACHLVHAQKISLQPRKLLQSIPGIEFIELPEANWCCGSAGIYNVTRPEDSMKILERKMINLSATNADVVVTANPGCHLQLQFGIKKFGLKIEVLHPVSLLYRAYQK